MIALIRAQKERRIKPPLCDDRTAQLEKHKIPEKFPATTAHRDRDLEGGIHGRRILQRSA